MMNASCCHFWHSSNFSTNNSLFIQSNTIFRAVHTDSGLHFDLSTFSELLNFINSEIIILRIQILLSHLIAPALV